MVSGQIGELSDNVVTNEKEAESASFYIGVTY